MSNKEKSFTGKQQALINKILNSVCDALLLFVVVQQVF